MKSIKGSLVGLILAGILALAPTAAFAHRAGGGGHFGGFAGRGFGGMVLPAMASHKTKGRTLRGTEIISGAEDLSFLETPFGMITHTTGIIIRTTAKGAKLRVV